MVLHGPVTNRDSLVAILRSPAFLAGETTTAFLDEHPEVLDPQVEQADLDRHALSAAAAVLELERPDALVPVGWRNVSGPLPSSSGCVTARHRRRSLRRRRGTPRRRSSRSTGGRASTVVATVDRRVGEVPSAPGTETRCSSTTACVSTAWTIAPRFADHSADAVGHGAVTPVPGTITAVHVEAGESVTAGQVLVLLEAMKMEHRILADVDGVVARVLVEVGQSVDAHALVVEFDEESDSDEESGEA